MKISAIKTSLILWLLALSYLSNAQPPNNTIFYGGIGDGFTNGSFAVASNNIYAGGIGDGWHYNSFNPAPNSIYVGGIGDGWHYNSFNPAPNSIYAGGIGDGWSNNNFGLPPNSIFLGGIGDGWSKIIYPLGPLPVTLLSFTGMQQGKTNQLNWITSQEINTAYFILERSGDAANYIAIKNVTASGNSTISRNYLSVDELPLTGNNFYRLKMVDKDGSFKYSNIVLLKVLANDMMLSVFPNPTADKLNISITNVTPISSIQIEVFDNSGKLITRQDIANSNGAVLDVSRFASGMYILKISYSGKQETIRFVKSK